MSPPPFQAPVRTQVHLTFGGRLLLPLAAAGLIATWLAGGTSGLFSATAFGLLLVVPLAARQSVRGIELSLPGSHLLPVGQSIELTLQVHKSTQLAAADVAILAGADPQGDPRPVGALGRLESGATARVPILLRFFERGRSRSLGLTLISTYPFGLVQVAQVFELGVDLWAVPRLGVVQGLALPPGSSARPSLGARRESQGDLEFAGVRPWREGESLRRVHWPLSARADRWVTRVLQDEQDPPLQLGLVNLVQQPGLWERRDASFEKAVSLFASLAARELARGRSVTAFLGAKEDTFSVTVRGQAGLVHLLRQLAEIPPQPGDPWSVVPDVCNRHLRRGSDVVLVLAGGGRAVANPEGLRILDVDEPAVARRFDREPSPGEVRA